MYVTRLASRRMKLKHPEKGETFVTRWIVQKVLMLNPRDCSIRIHIRYNKIPCCNYFPWNQKVIHTIEQQPVRFLEKSVNRTKKLKFTEYSGYILFLKWRNITIRGVYSYIKDISKAKICMVKIVQCVHIN